MELLMGTAIGFTVGLAGGLRVRHCQIRAVRELWMWERWRSGHIQRALNRQPSYRRRLP